MNIWSSWCVPCREEHKFLMELNKEKNLEIIGLNNKDKVLNAKEINDIMHNIILQVKKEINAELRTQ